MHNKTKLLALEVAVPEYFFTQKEAFEQATEIFNIPEENRRIGKTLYEISGISKRHSVLPDFQRDRIDKELYTSHPTEIFTEKRMLLYETKAFPLLKKALDKLNITDIKKCTHLILVSCTGMYTPGLDFEIIEYLGLSRTIARAHIQFMGCSAAITAMRQVDAICKSDDSAFVLMVSIELCSLHFNDPLNRDQWLANSLFADGCAVSVWSAQDSQSSILEIEGFHTEYFPDSKDLMGWRVQNTGFGMRLSSKVPKCLETHLPAFWESFEQKFPKILESIHSVGIHPGGKRILEVVDSFLRKKYSDSISTEDSFATLSDYGNMSSATIMFVLKRILHSQTLENEFIPLLAFGPGLHVEACIVRVNKN